MPRFIFFSVAKLLKLTVTLFSLFALQVSATSITTTAIPPQTAELGQTLTVNISQRFTLNDPVTGEVMSFATNSPIPASISGADLLITPAAGTSVNVYTFTVTASTNKTTATASLTFEVAVPTAQRSDPEFPLVSVIFKDSSGAPIIDDANTLGYIVKDRKPLELVSFPSSPSFNTSTNKISNGYCDNFYEEAIDNLTTATLLADPVINLLTGNISKPIQYSYLDVPQGFALEDLFAKATTDGYTEYVELLQANQLCQLELSVFELENAEAICIATATDLGFETSACTVDPAVGSPEGLEQLLSNTHLDNLISILPILAADGASFDYPNVVSYNFSTAASFITTSLSRSSSMSMDACQYANGTSTDISAYIGTPFEATANLLLNLSEDLDVILSDNGTPLDASDDTFTSDKQIWVDYCTPIVFPNPVSSPKGKGVESAKTLYALGYRSIPQTKPDGEYDEGMVIYNAELITSPIRSSYGAFSETAPPLISSGIQNGPHYFYYEQYPDAIIDDIKQHVADTIDTHPSFTGLEANSSSQPSTKGYILESNMGVGPITFVDPVSKLQSIVNTNVWLKSKGDGASSYTSNASNDLSIANTTLNAYITVADVTDNMLNAGNSMDSNLSNNTDSAVTTASAIASLISVQSSLPAIHQANLDLATANALPATDANKATSITTAETSLTTATATTQGYISDATSSLTALAVFSTTIASHQSSTDSYLTLVNTVLANNPGMLRDTMETLKISLDSNNTSIISLTTYLSSIDTAVSSAINTATSLVSDPNNSTLNSDLTTALDLIDQLEVSLSISVTGLVTQVTDLVSSLVQLNTASQDDVTTATNDVALAVSAFDTASANEAALSPASFSSTWASDNDLRLVLDGTATSVEKTILDLYNEGFNWDNKKCSMSGDTGCVFALSIILSADTDSSGCGGFAFKFRPGWPATSVLNGIQKTDVFINARKLATSITKKNTGSGWIEDDYFSTDYVCDLSASSAPDQVKADLYYTFTYDEMYNNDFVFTLDDFGIILAPGFFYSAQVVDLENIDVLNLKMGRYESSSEVLSSDHSTEPSSELKYLFIDSKSIDADPTISFDYLIKDDNNNGLLDGVSELALIKSANFRPSSQYCQQLGYSATLSDNGYCTMSASPCATGLDFDSTTGYCKSADLTESDLCPSPPAFNPIGLDYTQSVSFSSDEGKCIYTYDVAAILPESCLEIKTLNPSATTGNYRILINSSTHNVYCDMDFDQGGWTLAIRTADEPVFPPNSIGTKKDFQGGLLKPRIGGCDSQCHMVDSWTGTDLINDLTPHISTTAITAQKYKGAPFYFMPLTSAYYKSLHYNYPAHKIDYTAENLYGSDRNVLLDTLKSHSKKINPEELYIKYVPPAFKILSTTKSGSNQITNSNDLGTHTYQSYAFTNVTGVLGDTGNEQLLAVSSATYTASRGGNHLTSTSIKVITPGIYNGIAQALSGSDWSTNLCDPYVEIITSSITNKINICENDGLVDVTFTTTIPNEIITINVFSDALAGNEYNSTQFTIPTNQPNVTLPRYLQNALGLNRCGRGYQLTANSASCVAVLNRSCPPLADGTRQSFLTRGDYNTCGTLPTECSVSDLEQTVQQDQTIIYGNCKIPATNKTSIDVLKDISAKVFYNKFIITQSNMDNVKPSDLPGLEISEKITDMLLTPTKNHYLSNTSGCTVGDTLSEGIVTACSDTTIKVQQTLDLWAINDEGNYNVLNDILSKSESLPTSSELTHINNTYGTNEESRSKFQKALGITKSELPVFTIDSLGLTFTPSVRKINDINLATSSNIGCSSSELSKSLGVNSTSTLCISLIPRINGVWKYKWDPQTDTKSVPFKITTQNNKSIIELSSTINVSGEIDNYPFSGTTDERTTSLRFFLETNPEVSEQTIVCPTYNIEFSTNSVSQSTVDANLFSATSIGEITCQYDILEGYSQSTPMPFVSESHTTFDQSLIDSPNVTAKIGITSTNNEFEACTTAATQTNNASAFQIGIETDAISLQSFEKPVSFHTNPTLYFPSELSTSYIKEKFIQGEIARHTEFLIGTIDLTAEGNPIRDTNQNIVVTSSTDTDKSIMFNILTDTGASRLIDDIITTVRGSFPYSKDKILLNIPISSFKDDADIGSITPDFARITTAIDNDTYSTDNVVPSIDNNGNTIYIPSPSSLRHDVSSLTNDGYIINNAVLETIGTPRATIPDSTQNQLTIRPPIKSGSLISLSPRTLSEQIFGMTCNYLSAPANDLYSADFRDEYFSGADYVIIENQPDTQYLINSFFYASSDKAQKGYIELSNEYILNKQIRLSPFTQSLKFNFNIENKKHLGYYVGATHVYVPGETTARPLEEFYWSSGYNIQKTLLAETALQPGEQVSFTTSEFNNWLEFDFSNTATDPQDNLILSINGFNYDISNNASLSVNPIIPIANSIVTISAPATNPSTIVITSVRSRPEPSNPSTNIDYLSLSSYRALAELNDAEPIGFKNDLYFSNGVDDSSTPTQSINVKLDGITHTIFSGDTLSTFNVTTQSYNQFITIDISIQGRNFLDTTNANGDIQPGLSVISENIEPIYVSESTDKIGTADYGVFYNKFDNSEFENYINLDFSELGNNEINIDFDNEIYLNLDLETRNKCESIYGKTSVTLDPSSVTSGLGNVPSTADLLLATMSLEARVTLAGDTINYIPNDVIIDYTTENTLDTISSSISTLSELKCSNEALSVGNDDVFCDTSLSRSLGFNKLYIINSITNEIVADFSISGSSISFNEINSSIFSSAESFFLVNNFAVNETCVIDELTSSLCTNPYKMIELHDKISRFLHYSPEHQIKIVPTNFSKNRADNTAESINIYLTPGDINVDDEIDQSISLARQVCINSLNFDEDIINEMKEKAEIYSILKTNLSNKGLVDKLFYKANTDPSFSENNTRIRQAQYNSKEKQSLRIKLFGFYWSGNDAGDIRNYLTATQSAEDALHKYITQSCTPATDYAFSNNLFQLELSTSTASNPVFFCDKVNEFFFNPYSFTTGTSSNNEVTIQIDGYLDMVANLPIGLDG